MNHQATALKELQEKIEVAWNKKVDHNKTIQGKRSFRNPSLHGNLVIENNIEELGTSLPPHLCDDHLFGKESCSMRN